MNYIKDLVDSVYTNYQKGNTIEIPENYIDEYTEYFNDEFAKNGNSARSYAKRKFMRTKMLNSPQADELKSILYEMYWSDEYGIKSLAKELSISYSECRTLFSLLDIPIRKGYDVVTSRLRKLRSENLKDQYIDRRGFFTSMQRKSHLTQRGVGGYYFNESRNKYVWLRSSWEYIYARYLDTVVKVDWDVECRSYIIEGVQYTPDFFIFNDATVLDKIVEIKGFWDCREWKTIKLNSILNIDVILIKDIKKYIPCDSSYGKELFKWKQIRKLKI
jgi:hypothetical protein